MFSNSLAKQHGLSQKIFTARGQDLYHLIDNLRDGATSRSAIHSIRGKRNSIQSALIKREHGELYIFRHYYKPLGDCLSSGI